MDRPWITPKDVIDYTDLDDVAKRSEEKLSMDILRAEAYIIDFTNNKFDGVETIPEDVKMADILLTEFYAHNQQSYSAAGALKSESYDDYSYTAGDNSIDIKKLGIDVLLKPYVVTAASAKLILNLRKL